MESRGYVSISPQIEIFEYGKGSDKLILLAPDSAYRIKNPKALKTRYTINDASKEIFLQMDGTKTLEDIENHLVEEFQGESRESIRMYIIAFEQMLRDYDDIAMTFSKKPSFKPITYLAFESAYPSVISLELTNQCNLRCRHCYGDFGSNRVKTEISESAIDPLFSSFQEIGVTTVELTGGDPSVYPYTAKAIESAFEHGITNVTYLSNGVYLPQNVFNALVEHKDNVLVQVDLHSTRDEYCEWFTGMPDTVGRVERTIKKIINADISVFVTMIVTPGNIGDVADVAKWAYETGAKLFSISPVIELGRAFGEKNDLILSSEEDVTKFNRIISELNDRYANFLKKSKNLKDLDRNNCGAILPRATIDYRGYIKICPMDSFPDLGKSFGNVLKESIRSVFDSHTQFIKAFTDLRPPDMFDETCSGCANAVFCHACVARGLQAAQDESIECYWYDNTVHSAIKENLGLKE